MPRPAELAVPRSAPIGWGAFLGVSWTWCIGMYLPVLMVRDLGLAGYLVFAIPNVLGAAAMGWVLRTPEASVRLVTRHRAACVSFSIVTNAYHVYWVSWLLFWGAMRIGLPWWVLGALVGAGVFAGVCQIAMRHDGLTRVLSMGVLIVSLLVLAFMLSDPTAVSPTSGEALAAVPFSADAFWMLPVSALGFALCPYLDLTFNRARQACVTPGASRIAFGVGFGVFFALMIVLTLVYAGPLGAFVDGDAETMPRIAPMIAIGLGVHVALQAVFTVMAHRHEVARSPRPAGAALTIAAVVSLVLGLAAAHWSHLRPFDMAIGEVGYRVFLSFYGLVFPAYVWLNVVDLRRLGQRTATRRSLIVTGVAIVLAAPFYFVGFILLEEPWLAPGLAIILLSKLAAGPSEGRDTPAAGAPSA